MLAEYRRQIVFLLTPEGQNFFYMYCLTYYNLTFSIATSSKDSKLIEQINQSHSMTSFHSV